MRQALLITLLLLLGAQTVSAGSASGKVTKVVDGDTIEVVIGGKAEKVRIYGINSPEKGDPLWKAAKLFTEKLTLGKNVKLLTKGRGYYKRLLAYVIIENRSVGLELVKSGLAVVYSNSFAPENPRTYMRYKMAQIHAMSGDLGIWKAGR